jgi:hypothetical protein
LAEASARFPQQEREAGARSPSQQLPESQANFITAFVASQLVSKPAARAWAIAKSGGRTPFLRAQVSRSAKEWQQQDRQHWSADWQPQRDMAQGNSSCDSCSRGPSGKGTPVAVTTNARSNIALTQLRRRGALFSSWRTRVGISLARR